MGIDSSCITQLQGEVMKNERENEMMVLPSFHFSCVYIILTFAHLGGWLAASQICFKGDCAMQL